VTLDRFSFNAAMCRTSVKSPKPYRRGFSSIWVGAFSVGFTRSIHPRRCLPAGPRGRFVPHTAHHCRQGKVGQLVSSSRKPSANTGGLQASRLSRLSHWVPRVLELPSEQGIMSPGCSPNRTVGCQAHAPAPNHSHNQRHPSRRTDPPSTAPHGSMDGVPAPCHTKHLVPLRRFSD
jgi:hypothetical protein